jgi:hypothetical protein
MSEKELIAELKNLVEYWSFNIPDEDEQNIYYRVVEVNHVNELIKKFEKQLRIKI